MNATPLGRRRTARRLLVPAALLVLPLTSACSAGTSNFDAQTNQIYNVAEGVNDRSGEVDVLNALVVSAQPGSGRLIAGLVNNSLSEDAEVTGVQGAGQDRDVTVDLSGGQTTIGAGEYLQLADAGSAVILVSGDRVAPGNFVELTFSFRNGQPSTMQIPVVDQRDDFKDVEVPSATGTASSSLVAPTDKASGQFSDKPSDKSGG